MSADVVVLGGGIGGLTAAALLARWGLKVTLLDQNPKPGGLITSFSQSGYTFDLGASSLWGFGYGEVFHWLFKELRVGHLLDEEEGVISQLDPPIQLILPDHRVNVYSDPALYLEEIRREYPQQASAFAKVHQDLLAIEEEIFTNNPKQHPYSMADRYNKQSAKGRLKYLVAGMCGSNRTLWDLLKSEGASEMAPLLALQSFFFSKAPLLKLPLSVASIITGIARRGMFQVPGGTGGLAGLLEDQITVRGGKVLCNAKVEEIIVRNGRVRGVKAFLAGKNVELDAKYVVADLPLDQVEEQLLPSKGSLFTLFKKNRRNAPIPRILPFSLFLGIDSKAVPEPMSERSLLMRSYEERAGDMNTLSIFVSSDKDKRRAPYGKRTVTATYWMPVEEAEKIDWKNEKKKKAEEVTNHLEQVIPFVHDFQDTSFAYTPVDYEEKIGRGGEAVQSNGLFRKKLSFSVRNRIKGLFLTGEGAYPLAGVAHAAKAGVRTAEEIKKEGYGSSTKETS